MTNAVNVASLGGATSADSSGNFKFNSGYGSDAVAYGCRAWVNFNGTGTVAIRASGNVSSITDLGTGGYQVNFATAMPDANYCVQLSARSQSVLTAPGAEITTTYVQVQSLNASFVGVDVSHVFVSIFR